MALNNRNCCAVVTVLFSFLLFCCASQEKAASGNPNTPTPQPPITEPGGGGSSGSSKIEGHAEFGSAYNYDPSSYSVHSVYYTNRLIVKFTRDMTDSEMKAILAGSGAQVASQGNFEKQNTGKSGSNDTISGTEEPSVKVKVGEMKIIAPATDKSLAKWEYSTKGIGDSGTKSSFARWASKSKKITASDIDTMVKALKKDTKNVAYVSPEYYRHVLDLTFNDAKFNKQWALNENFLNIRDDGWKDVFDQEKEVRVAVIDTGYRPHEDLQDKIIERLGYDFISDPDYSGDGDGIDDDPTDMGDSPGGNSNFFHGTFVAGIIAANRDNNMGIVGLTGKVKIIHVRVLGKNGSGSDYDIAQGILYAAGLPNASPRVLSSGPNDPDRRADIINLSLGGEGDAPIIHDAIQKAVAAGVTVVCAAGNDAELHEKYEIPIYPAAYDECISVGALSPTSPGENYKRAKYSDYQMNVKIMAPGGSDDYLKTDPNGVPEGIYSTMWKSYPECIGKTVKQEDISNCSDYQPSAGTSFATPHISAVAALMKSANPNLNPVGIASILFRTAKPDNDKALNQLEFGYGIADALKALGQAKNAQPQEKIFVKLVDIKSRAIVAKTETGSSSDFSFTLDKVPEGVYVIYSGTDYDNNGKICEKGEKFGRYPDPDADKIEGVTVSTGKNLKDIKITLKPVMSGNTCPDITGG